ncbi:hypothetical protein AMTRI_Chr12g235400 [Amborella trichopoda]
MYDASVVRLCDGQQAELAPFVNYPLRELLGHTPIQVVEGAVLGCMVAYLMREIPLNICSSLSHTRSN